MRLRRRDAFMSKPSAESGTVAFGLPLTRRRALTRAGACLAGIGLGAASGRPSQLLAQEASPPADEPAPVDAPGIVTSQRAAPARPGGDDAAAIRGAGHGGSGHP